VGDELGKYAAALAAIHEPYKPGTQIPATFRPRLPLSGVEMTPTGILYAIARENGLAFIDTETDTIVGRTSRIVGLETVLKN
jgi:hypothetical protein